MKTKPVVETAKAFEKIFDKGRSSRKIQIDRGNEFCNEEVKNFLKRAISNALIHTLIKKLRRLKRRGFNGNIVRERTWCLRREKETTDWVEKVSQREGKIISREILKDKRQKGYQNKTKVEKEFQTTS